MEVAKSKMEVATRNLETGVRNLERCPQRSCKTGVI